MLRKIILVAGLVFIAPATADVQTPSGRVIECFCTGSQGERHEIGEVVCLKVGGRAFMAKCVMAQNNPFWRDQNMPCVAS